MEHLPDSYIEKPVLPEPEPEYEDSVIALAQHLNCEPEEIAQSDYDDNTLEYGKRQYLVVTDAEADRLWDEYLDSYLDEVILPEVPEYLHFYFDEDAWKRDARNDGRAHSLGRYDGNEYEQEVGGTTYYIYRQN